MSSRVALLLAMTFLAASSLLASDSQSSSTADSTGLDFANGLYARKMYAPAASEYEKFINDAGGSGDLASARFRLADSYYFLKDYSKAISNFEIFLKDFPEDKRIWVGQFRLNTAKFYVKDFSGAISGYSKLSSEAKDASIRAGAFFYLAKIYKIQKNNDESLKVLNNLIQNYPESEYAAWAGLILGDLYVEEGKAEEALKVYQLTAAKNTPVPVVQEAILKIADIYFRNKDHQNALLFYRKIQKDSPFFSRAFLGTVYSDYYTQNLEESIRLIGENEEFLTKVPERYEIYTVVSDLSYQQKNYEAALKFTESILKDPKVDQVYLEKSLYKKTMILNALGRKEEALSELQKITQGDFKSVSRAFFERGEILRESGKNEEAKQAYQEALKEASSPYERQALYALGSVAFDLGQKEEARKYFSEIIQKYPKEEDAERAMLQMIQIDYDLGHLNEAAQLAERFSKDYPQSKFLDIAFYKLGAAWTGLKEFEKASDAFRKVVTDFEKSQVFMESLYGLAASLESANRIEEAIAVNERLIQQFPDSPLAKEIFPHLGYLYIRLEKYDKAADFYREIILKKTEVSIEPKLAFWLVRFYLDRSQYDLMQEILNALPARFPGSDFKHEVSFFLGESSTGLKDFTKATEHYTESIKGKPDGDYVPHAHLGLGIIYAAQGNDTLSETHLNEALRYDSEADVTLRARFEIARLRLRQGSLEEAAKAFMLVAILYDDQKHCPLALFLAAECFTKLNQPDNAQKAYEELKARYPESEWAKKTADSVERIENRKK